MRWLCLLLVVPAWHGAHAHCWEAAGARHAIDPVLLKAIAWKESRGNPDAIGPLLRDGQRALGLMQINTVHLPALAPYGIGRTDLFNACTSQAVGAWVLANCIAQWGKTWKAVGCYYAGPRATNLAAQAAYVRDVQRYYAGFQRQALAAPMPATPGGQP